MAFVTHEIGHYTLLYGCLLALSLASGYFLDDTEVHNSSDTQENEAKSPRFQSW